MSILSEGWHTGVARLVFGSALIAASTCISLPGRLRSATRIFRWARGRAEHLKCPLVGVTGKWLANCQNDAIDPLLTLQAANLALREAHRARDSLMSWRVGVAKSRSMECFRSSIYSVLMFASRMVRPYSSYCCEDKRRTPAPHVLTEATLDDQIRLSPRAPALLW